MDEEREQSSGLIIPKLFYSTDTKAPITHCIDCDYDLLNGDRYYIIEKVFKRYDQLGTVQVLFEYGICNHCYDKMKDGLSDDSMFTLSNYMMNKTDIMGMQRRIEEHPGDPEQWLKNCMIKGTDVSEMNEYQIGACFKGDRLVTNFMPPFMIGGAAMEEITELLSKQTKDEMDGFMGDHFGIPPELRKDLILI